MSRVLIVGSTSALAQALAREYAAEGHRLLLAARDPAAQGEIAAHLRIVWGASVDELEYDASDSRSCASLAEAAAAGGAPDRVFFVAGATGEESAMYSPAAVESIARINFLSVAGILSRLLPVLEKKPGCRIVLIGSVAGDRGRATNPLYCAAKSALATYAQGLRQHLHRYGVKVCLVRLGYVDSPMSYGRAPALLTISPARAASLVKRACEAGKDVVYVPRWWAGVMTVLKAVPEGLWKRLGGF